MKKILCLLTLLAGTVPLWAQETFTVNDVRDERSGAFAFTGATIYTDYQTRLENATLLIREGKVVSVGTGAEVPTGYVVFDVKGKTLYPALIDIYTGYGLPDPPRRERRSPGAAEQLDSNTEGAYNTNEAIKSEYNAAEHFKVDAQAAGQWRAQGFGTLLSHFSEGLARGSSVLVSLAEDTENNTILKREAAAHYSFNKGSSGQSYPSSAMGYIALLRQTYLDARWYASQPTPPFTDLTLVAWQHLQSLPQIFEVGGWISLLRADTLGDEFGVQYIMVAGGDEYQRIDQVKATGASLILPLNFPKPPEVDDPLEAQRVSLAALKHWELAPTNPARLEAAGIRFALTAHGLKKPDQFWENLRRAIKLGLSEKTALAALTQTPAALLGVQDQVGVLKPGSVASFLITSGSLFDKKTLIHESWVQGKRYIQHAADEPDLSGAYELTVADLLFDMEMTGKPGKYQVKITAKRKQDPFAPNPESAAEPQEETPAGEKADHPRGGMAGKIKVTAEVTRDLINLSFKPKGSDLPLRLTGWPVGRDWQGSGSLSDGRAVSWRAAYLGEVPKKGKSEKVGEENGKQDPEESKPDGEGEAAESEEATTDTLGAVIYPFVAYGSEQLPEPQNLVIRDASVWTNEADGKLTETDVLVIDGKIAAIGRDLAAGNARVIDGKGKHLTPGIIDEHSHIALSSVNDVATNSGMVRMADVVDSEDINIYRNLAGGVVAAQLLHGSANPIGGQSALVKLRWGAAPRAMLIDGADGFIKFALGENVKRSRSQNSIRYPQTRMGVAQVYEDAFSSAREYEKAWQAYEGLPKRSKQSAIAPRRDLALETMLEILNGKRFITCHSYVQSEINMLMKVAESYGFRVNTFTHILEGYKVADIMAAHGAGGSTFADWWAYKWEVIYAIPYNATLMHDAGVVTAVNSDSAEMSRRLNQEAAKAVKYGGMPEEEALKLVTLNPAKLLHLDKHMGSIRVGKDADLVLWSDHPLSIYARAEQTMVDGTVYYDRDSDAQKRDRIAAERRRLVGKLLGSKKQGEGHGKPGGPKPEWHCDDIVEYWDGGL